MQWCMEWLLCSCKNTESTGFIRIPDSMIRWFLNDLGTDCWFRYHVKTYLCDQLVLVSKHLMQLSTSLGVLFSYIAIIARFFCIWLSDMSMSAVGKIPYNDSLLNLRIFHCTQRLMIRQIKQKPHSIYHAVHHE